MPIGRLSAGGCSTSPPTYRERTLRDAGAVAQFIYHVPRISRLDRLLLRSNTSLNVGTFIFLSLSLGLIGGLLGVRFLPQVVPGLVLGVASALIPYLFLKWGERKAQRAFYEQLPEALDLLARAVRTGHALTSAMEIVSTEMADPISQEFAAVVDEVKFGITFDDALNNMCHRMPLTDLRYFAITVIIHKETGGNIAQIFDNLSALIRERLQFRRQVKALTAEGRLSAFVLLLLPIIMFGYIYLVNYDYASILWTDPGGKKIMLGAIFAQIVGFFVMRRMVDIQV